MGKVACGVVTRAAVVAATLAAVAGCTSSDGSGAPPTTGVVEVGPLPAGDSAAPVPASVEAGSAPGSDAAASTLVADPGDTGVPGLDDPEALCSAWSRYVGTTQMLSIAANFGALDAVAMARLEVVAAPTVRAAVADIDASLPPELDAERTDFVERVVGPVERRAARAESLLAEAGAAADDLDVLRTTWLDVLRRRDPSAAVPTVAIADATLAAQVDDAAAALAAALTPYISDPSLDVSGVDTPMIDAHLAAECPDLSSVGVGDAV